MVSAGLQCRAQYSAGLMVGSRAYAGTRVISIGGTGEDSFGGALGLDHGCRAFRDAPNVSSWSLLPWPAGASYRLDIWHRSFGALGLVDVAPADPPLLVAGIVAHVAERVAMREGLPGQAPGAGGSVCVGSIFDSSVGDGVRLRAIGGRLPDGPSPRPEVAGPIRQALGAGQVVIVPERVAVVGGRPRLG